MFHVVNYHDISSDPPTREGCLKLFNPEPTPFDAIKMYTSLVVREDFSIPLYVDFVQDIYASVDDIIVKVEYIINQANERLQLSTFPFILMYKEKFFIPPEYQHPNAVYYATQFILHATKRRQILKENTTFKLSKDIVVMSGEIKKTI